MKCKALILTHGKLASALADTVEFVCGERENIIAIDLPDPFDQSAYEAAITDVVEENEGTLILCDLFGGSPFLTSARIVKEHADKTQLLTGVNLGMLLEIVPMLEEGDLNEIKEAAMRAGKEGIVDIKERLGM